jgi:acetyl esterase/lipase
VTLGAARKIPLLALLALFASGISASRVFAAKPPLLTGDDLVHFTSPPPDVKIAYGSDPLQFGELRLPEGEGRHPVVIFVHGGCWLSEYDLSHTRKLTAALAARGVAVWSLEYRRVGDEGGGWPGTFQDVARGADFLRSLARDYPLDLGRVVAAGHSAGGHLALWLGARPRLPKDSPLYTPDPISVAGVLALAPAPDLEPLEREGVCGNVIDGLVGGSPDRFPERYLQVSGTGFVPLGLPQTLIVGAYDASWAPAGRLYYETALRAGDHPRLVEAPESGHFEMIDPDSTTWPLVEDALADLLGRPKPSGPQR